MARRWVVLTAGRGSISANQIIEYTEWDGRVALSDEVIYTDPVDAGGDSVDDAWKVGGNVVLAAGVYTYSAYVGETTLVERQRSQIYEAYLYWRIFGRTSHWIALRRGVLDMDGNDTTDIPLDATDKWAVHILALVDHAILGTFPSTGAYTAAELQAFIDHADTILRTLGPTWYLAQLEADTKRPTSPSGMYAGMSVEPSGPIYTDIVTLLGVLRGIDGEWGPMNVTIRTGFDPESRTLGN